MSDEILPQLDVREDDVKPLLIASNTSTIDEALHCLIHIAKTSDGRLELASKNAITLALQLCRSLAFPSHRHLILLSLKLIRNLCAGEIANQNSFIEWNGVGTVANVIQSAGLAPDFDNEIIRMALHLLGNVSLAGNGHQSAIWHHFFPLGFLSVARIRSKDTCDPLCMVIYTCCQCDLAMTELCTDQGLSIMLEILRTASSDGFGEDWIKLLLKRICLQESCFPSIFSRLYQGSTPKDNNGSIDHFEADQAFILSILSEILNEQLTGITICNNFAMSIFDIFRNVVEVVDFGTKMMSGLPTGSAAVDVLGYSLTILRDICARDCDEPTSFDKQGSDNVVDTLVSSGLIELLVGLLRDLEPPVMIRKAMNQSQSRDGAILVSSKCCPYKGFRRDIVAILGNCAHRRKRVQDEIRDRNGILLLLQHCVVDDDNPFLREWGIWSMRNLLEGNAENHRVVSDLELQGTADVPELAGLGLRVEVDPRTRRAKLVNVS